MTKQTEAAAVDVLTAVTRDDPAAARAHIRELSFQGRALLMAWAVELSRLIQDEQYAYDAKERRIARETRETEADASTCQKILRARVRRLAQRTDAEALTVRALEFLDLGRSRPWIAGELEKLTDEGVLKPDPSDPGRYFILRAPDGDTTADV
ncbi:hypothetical protein [Streptomyces sp. NRRL S-455]|uniref:hypothetical protein n=1 Tax=Streptomyces sp. NRRL S-455 TaxID=1463908 RepID=UPI0004BEF34A|nr:hypothetical protein [Streptomyces sp. NRRL S-455]